MAKLADLPVEVLESIFDCHYKGTQTLSALSRVCKRIGAVANVLLYRHVVMDTINEDHPFQTGRLLLCTLVERPDIGSEIASFDFSWESQERGLETTLQRILALMPHLNCLQLTGPFDPFDFMPAVELDFLNGYLSPSLTSLTLKNRCTFSLDSILDILALPNLTRLDIDCYHEDRHSEHNPLSSKKNDVNDLNAASLVPLSLCIGSDAGTINCMSPDSFRSILQKRPNVVKFEAIFPGMKQDSPFAKPHEQTFSPRTFVHRISSISSTLIELRIDPASGYWFPIDGSRLDLSSFPQLTKLSVPSECYFIAQLPSPSRCGIWKLLPRSLVTFEILFVGQGIFCFGWSPQSFYEFEKQGCVASPATYSWMQELVEYKSTYFPGLARITLRHLCEERKQAIWELPEPLKSLAIDAGLDLSVIWKRSSYSMHPERWSDAEKKLYGHDGNLLKADEIDGEEPVTYLDSEIQAGDQSIGESNG